MCDSWTEEFLKWIKCVMNFNRIWVLWTMNLQVNNGLQALAMKLVQVFHTAAVRLKSSNPLHRVLTRTSYVTTRTWRSSKEPSCQGLFAEYVEPPRKKVHSGTLERCSSVPRVLVLLRSHLAPFFNVSLLLLQLKWIDQKWHCNVTNVLSLRLLTVIAQCC